MADTRSSSEVLQAYLVARATFSPEELAFITTVFVPRRLAAGEFLQRGGEVARHAAFVAHGCLRSFVIDPKGKEHVVQFAPEEWWLADAISLNTGTPSQYFFAAIEDSELLLIDAPGHQQIIDRIPGYSAAMRAGLQKHAAAKDLRIVIALSASAEERYLDFMRTFPTIAQRVPQWMVASYLGVSPETVSRIRKHLQRKQTRGGLPRHEDQAR
jgi:CRP/FNR family transcriptional regulator, anaerobic regulatory protein